MKDSNENLKEQEELDDLLDIIMSYVKDQMMLKRIRQLSSSWCSRIFRCSCSKRN